MEETIYKENVIENGGYIAARYNVKHRCFSNNEKKSKVNDNQDS